MPIVALSGLRGGVGTTSVTAALAWALNRLGERTMVIDFSPHNQLRAHFNTPVTHSRGWAHSDRQQQPWQQSAMRYTEQLDFIPFGDLPADEKQNVMHQPEALLTPWAARLAALRKTYRWILLDMPAELPRLSDTLLAQADHSLVVLNADGNAHLRLHQTIFPPNTLFLLNQFSSLSKAQQDLHQLWLSSLKGMVPLLIHRDEALAEALLCKQPVGEYRPLSLGAEEIATLATWCLINLTGKAA
ncbi:cellulose synthase operon protein YhjQ [Erwinia persicina]|uniref:cellulose biosynthesis protein BcsQ n=1 Tax=Erwinia persicina TaxID=55211 RepID=UPI001C9A36E1|nr:cellulose biosynthesis protein BcsQ [Erwinia persicina]QZQ50336.1 cellulose synthase operon protein YhjQ [Erwinia persicina]